jgi:hypothetical protein
MAADWAPDDMEKAAFHEAGHAVVGWSFGVKVHDVYLDVANNSGAMRAPPEPLPDDVTHKVAIWYAGFEAEYMFKGPAVFVRAEGDFKRADEDLKNALANKFYTGLYSPQGRQLQAACRTCAQERLREHEARVRRVAEALLQPPHKIDAAKFEQLMREG